MMANDLILMEISACAQTSHLHNTKEKKYWKYFFDDSTQTQLRAEMRWMNGLKSTVTELNYTKCRISITILIDS